MLGLLRPKLRWLRAHRDPATEMYGWAEAAASTAEYDQLPPGEDEEACFESGEVQVIVSGGLASGGDVWLRRRDGTSCVDGTREGDRKSWLCGVDSGGLGGMYVPFSGVGVAWVTSSFFILALFRIQFHVEEISKSWIVLLLYYMGRCHGVKHDTASFTLST